MSICRFHHAKDICDPQLVEGKLHYYTTCRRCNTKLVKCAHCDISFDPQNKTITNNRYTVDSFFELRHKRLDRNCLSEFQPSKRHKGNHDHEVVDIEIPTEDNNNFIHASDDSVSVGFSTYGNDSFNDSHSVHHDASTEDKIDEDENVFSFINSFLTGCCWADHDGGTGLNNDCPDGSEVLVGSDHSLMSGTSSEEPSCNSRCSDVSSHEDTESYGTTGSIESWEQIDLDVTSNQENGTLVDHSQCHENESSNSTPERRGIEYGYEDFSFFRQENDGAINSNQLYFWEIYRAGKSQPQLNPQEIQSAGYRSLTYRAMKRNKSDSTALATCKEAELLFRMNKALLNVTVQSKRDVMSLVSCLCRSGDANLNSNTPQTYTEARNIILEGRHSIMQNFPSPKVFPIGNHACMSLKETVQHMAGHGADFEYTFDSNSGNRCNDGLHGTKGAYDICREAVKAMKACKFLYIAKTSIGWVYFWSDSFLRCFTKQKDNSVWLFAVTVCPPHSDISTGRFTRILAIGKSGNDHTDVINHYHNEIKEMMNGFRIFCRKTNTLRWISLGLLYTSADRPERQAILNVLKEGTFGKVSLYSAPIVTTKLPPCKKCYMQLIDKVALGERDFGSSSETCDKCFGWDIDPKDKNQAVFPVPPNYPRKTILTNDDGIILKPPKGREPGLQYLGPVRLSSKWMVVACVYAYEAKRRKRWNSSEFHTFLRTCNVCESRRKKIEETAAEDARKKIRSPLQDWLPELWLKHLDTFHIRKWPDVPLHAIGHGMGADVIEFLELILTSKKRASDFTKFANRIIEEISEFKLSWCKLLRYPKKAWVAEHVMGYMRLLSYIYGMYILNHPLGNDSKDLVEAMKRMLITLQPMMSILMIRSEPDNLEEYARLVRDHIKLFMTAAHYCDLEFIEEDKATTSTTKNSKVTDLITDRDAVTILDEISGTSWSSSTPKKSVDGITVKQLKDKSKAMGISYSKGAKKTEMQLLVFSSILGSSLTFSDTGPLTAVPAAAVSSEMNNVNDAKKLVWNKGGWLSYLTNCEEQINNLGSVTKIW